MMGKLTNGKIVMGICLPRSLKEMIDTKRRDISRSKYISRILEGQLEHENEGESTVYRAEESLKVDALLPEALDNIVHPYRSIENKLLDICQQIKELKYSLNNGTTQSAASRRL